MDVLEHRISDILQNHEQEQRAIERQITAERAKLLEDVERIRERVYPGGISYDNITLKTSTEPDMKLVNIADAIQRRTEKTEQVIAKLEKRLELIQRVYDTVLQMDARDKIILLTLYYPRRTYEQAAETLGIDVSTVSRRRKTAVKKISATVPQNLWEKIFQLLGKFIAYNCRYTQYYALLFIKKTYIIVIGN